MIRQTPTQDVVLRARGICKSYRDLAALTDLSCEVRAGEIVGLLGPNGAGKTTAIRVLSTILPADQGEFSVVAVPNSRPDEIRALIGVLPESYGLPPHLTGHEYLTYMGRLYGQSMLQVGDKAAELLRTFGLVTVGRAKIGTYSRGMRQRLAIARALINDPSVLFLDEPTLGLDPVGQREMLRVIQEAAEVNQVAIILSSHLLEVVDAICSRVIILNRGRVVAEGTVAEIKQRVSMARTCRVRVRSETVAKAIAALSALPGVRVDLHVDQKDELIVSTADQTPEAGLNAVLEHLIQAEVPIESFSRESVRLNDAFLAMIEEV